MSRSKPKVNSMSGCEQCRVQGAVCSAERFSNVENENKIRIETDTTITDISV